MVIYNVQSNGDYNQLIIELINDTVYIDPQSVAYVFGNINMDVTDYNASKWAKSLVVGKSLFKPKFSGTGKIFLHATLGSYHKFALKDQDELFINPKIFMACRDSLELSPQINFSVKNFLNGVPMVQLLARGNGSVMVLMPGPVQEMTLNDEKFVAIAQEVAAYTPSLNVTREIVCKNLLPEQKMGYVYRGNGRVYFSPIPNKDARSRISK